MTAAFGNRDRRPETPPQYGAFSNLPDGYGLLPAVPINPGTAAESR